MEVFALRQQILILQRNRPRPKSTAGDRLFWVLLSGVWGGWKRSLILFQPKTVVRWQRMSFRLFWRWKSRAKGGRPALECEAVELTRNMWKSNPTWGAPRIRRELLKLGIRVSPSCEWW